MKKFFVSCAIFAVLIFVVSCGDISINVPDENDRSDSSSDKTDSSDSVTDEDTKNAETDKEINPADEPDDDSDSQSDGDNTDPVDDPCTPNPCNISGFTDTTCRAFYDEITATKFSCGGTDSSTKLTWSTMSDNNIATYDEAISYCDDLSEGNYTDWRLPNIDELRTLIQNCPGTETGGTCKISEENDCLSYDTCWTEDCKNCSEDTKGGHSKFDSERDTYLLWSSSKDPNIDEVWGANFYAAQFDFASTSIQSRVRCVRNAE